jgi:glycosyltransferase involved in cell wall biosynthesis
MRVLHVIASMDARTGGVAQAVRSLIQGQSSSGDVHEVVSLDNPASVVPGSEAFALHVLGPHATAWCFGSKLLPWLLEHLPRFDAVIVHGLWLYPSHAVRQAMKRLRWQGVSPPRCLIMPHGMLDPYFQRDPSRRMKALRNWVYWKFLEARAVAEADGLLFTCEQEKRLARQTFAPYRPRSEEVVGLGVECPPPRTAAMEQAFLSACPDLGKRPFLLFLSRIHPKKGVDLLLQAYEACGRKEAGGGGRRPEGGDLRPEGGDLRPEGGDLRPEGGDLRSEGGDLRPEGGDLRPEGGDLRPEGGDLRPEGGDLRPEGGDLRPEGGDLRPEGGDLRPEGGDLEQARETPPLLSTACSLLPHASSREPHAASLTPHAASRTPHASCRTPHAASRTPHASSREPHAASLTPHASSPPVPRQSPQLRSPVSGFSLSAFSSCLPALVIVGPGWDTLFGRQMRERVATVSAQGLEVHALDMLEGDAKWGAFHACEAFVLPSHQENFGIAVVEALACGKPVLISDQVNIWREIEADGAALVAPDTLQGTESLLQRWLALPDEARAAMSRDARRCFESKFEIGRAAERLLGIVRR